MLLELCQRFEVKLPLGPYFFTTVHQMTEEVEPITPDFFTVAFRREDAIEMFKTELHKRRSQNPGDPLLYFGALMPFCFQSLPSRSKGKTGGAKLFFVFANPEDGLIMIHRILSFGGYQMRNTFYEFTQIYELGTDCDIKIAPGASNGKVDGRIAYIILDWEVYEGRVQGRLSHQELRDLCLSFPDWFCAELYRLGLVKHDDMLTGECPVCFSSCAVSLSLTAV